MGASYEVRRLFALEARVKRDLVTIEARGHVQGNELVRHVPVCVDDVARVDVTRDTDDVHAQRLVAGKGYISTTRAMMRPYFPQCIVAIGERV